MRKIPSLRFLLTALLPFSPPAWAQIVAGPLEPALTTQHWRSLFVDSGVGGRTLLAHTTTGHPVIAYHGASTAKVASWDGGTWLVQTLGASSGGISLAMNPLTKSPGVSFVDGKLYYAVQTKRGWASESIEQGGVSPFDSSLAYDPMGNPGICYYHSGEGGAGIKFAWKVGSTWRSHLLGNASGPYLRRHLAFDASGNAAVVYITPQDVLMLAIGERVGNEFRWTHEAVDGRAEGLQSAVCFDGAGNLLVAHCATDHVRFLRRDGLKGNWIMQEIGHRKVVGSTLNGCSMIISGGTLALAVLGNSNSASPQKRLWSAKCLYKHAGALEWKFDQVENIPERDIHGGPGLPSIALTENGIRHLSYSVAGDLFYVKEDQAYTGPVLAFHDNMEGPLNSWTTIGNDNDPNRKYSRPSEGTRNLWTVSSRRGDEPGHSSLLSWYYGIESSGNYDSGTRNWGRLISPEIDLTIATRAEMTFSQFIQAEGGALENGEVQVSELIGGLWSPWVTVFSSSSRTNGLFHTQYPSINRYLGKRIRIGFFFDTKNKRRNEFEGWYVDDVSVKLWNAKVNSTE